MIIPEFLKRGDAIGVTAPSAGITAETDIRRFDNARRRISESGYGTISTPDVLMCDEEGRSASAEQRIEEWNALIVDPSVKAVFAISGGDYEYEMLPLMDWDLIERNPKWFQGYSDNTTLAFKITAEHDIATSYGGNFGDFGMEPWHPSVEQALEVLEGVRTEQDSFRMHAEGFVDRITGLEPFPEDAETSWTSSCGDVDFSGRLIGGCMDVLDWFVRKGTADPGAFVDRYADEGIVWYMETYDMEEGRIRGMLDLMEEKGWFDGCAGFVFGRPLFYRGESRYEDLVTEALSEFGVPVINGADVGHKAPRMAFINGARAGFSIRGDGCRLRYDLSSRCGDIRKTG